jgi:hypothetical protein
MQSRTRSDLRVDQLGGFWTDITLPRQRERHFHFRIRALSKLTG